MPIYEYRCQACHRVSSFFFKVASAARAVNCDHCGDAGMDRIMSSFSQGRTEADEYRNLDPRYYKMVDDALGKALARVRPGPLSSADGAVLRSGKVRRPVLQRIGPARRRPNDPGGTN